MPELPEVETIRLALQSKIKGRVIQSFEQSNKALRINIPPQKKQLAKKIVGKKIINLARRGKNMLWFLDQGILLIHLGMSGRILWQPKNITPQKHQHWQLDLSDISQNLIYIDPRRFGGIAYFQSYKSIEELLNQGPEPNINILPNFFIKLIPNHKFEPIYLFEKTRNSSKTIKDWLMDASKIAGIGNIYACEILFLAGVNPKRTAASIKKNESKKIFDATQVVLDKAIKAGGSTLRDYQKVDGNSGNFQDQFNVYNRELLSCKNCNNLLKKEKISNRSTYFCISCQK